MVLVLIATFLIAVGSVVYTELTKPKLKDNDRDGAIPSYRTPTATEDRPVPVIWGAPTIRGPNCTWWGHALKVAIKRRVKTGLFSSQRVLVAYAYHIGIQLCICRGLIDRWFLVRFRGIDLLQGIQRTNVDSRVDYDGRFELGGDYEGNGGMVLSMELHPGFEPGVAVRSDYLERFQNSDIAYGGTAYLVLRGLGADGTTVGPAYIGNDTDLTDWEIVVGRFPNPLGLSAALNELNPLTGFGSRGRDLNPASFLVDVLTSEEHGYGFPLAAIDLDNFRAAAQVLADEGNGISYALETQLELDDLLAEAERQIDGYVYTNPRTGLWEIKLARDDYDVDTIPELTSSNVIEIVTLSPGTFEGSTNEIRVKYRRDFDSDQATAIAQDMANAIQSGDGTPVGGRVVSATITFPMCRDPSLANNLAKRELLSASIPAHAATVRVNRTLLTTTPGDVLAWTDESLGFTKVPFRVIATDRSRIAEGTLTLDLVRDWYQFADGGIYAPPPDTEWDPPGEELDPYPTDEQIAFEYPTAFIQRDGGDGGPTRHVIWCSARRQADEVLFEIWARTASNPFDDSGIGDSFMLIGLLGENLSVGSSVPKTSLSVSVFSPQSEILDAIVAVSEGTLGEDLTNLILIGDEFMLVRSASAAGSDVSFANVYRGVMDSVQASHSIGDKVYVLSAGGAVTSVTFPPASVDIRLTPKSTTNSLDNSLATTISVPYLSRPKLPLPPSRVILNGTAWNATPSLEGSGSGLDGFGINLTLTRRDFRQTNEIDPLTTDAETLDPSFPAANSTVYAVEVIDDPSGSPASLFTTAQVDPPVLLLRLDILRATNGTLPTSLAVSVETYHDFTGVQRQAFQDADFSFAPTSNLTGQFEFGALDTNVSSATYTAAATGTFTLNIGTAFTGGAVEVNVAGGGFVTVIAAGLSTGTFSAATSDSVVVRHTSTDTGALTFIELKNPSSTAVAFGVLYV